MDREKNTHNTPENIECRNAEELVVIGDKLRQLREAQKITLDEITRDTKIQKHYITAIEEGRIEDLPKGPFVRSFIRQYCSYLSADDMWPKFDKLTANHTVTPVLNASKTDSYVKSSPKVFRHTNNVVMYILVAIIMVAAVYLLWQNHADFVTKVASPITGGTASISRQQNEDDNNLDATADIKTTNTEITVIDETNNGATGDKSVLIKVNTKDLANVTKEEVVSGIREATNIDNPIQSKNTKNAKQNKTDLSWMTGENTPVKKENAPKIEITLDRDDRTIKSTDLKIIPKDKIWIRVKKGAKTLFEGLLMPGDNRIFDASGESPLYVKFGNPEKTTLLWNGKVIQKVAPGRKPVTKYYWNDGVISDNPQR